MDSNPYSAPSVVPLKGERNGPHDSSTGIFETTLRRIALAVFLLPAVLAIPFHFWVFNLAGNWFVNTDIDPEERRAGLAMLYVLHMAAFCGAVALPGLILLFIDNYRRRLIGWLIALAIIPFIFAISVFALMVDCYFRFS